jgi:hypothetical protein
MLRAPNPRVFTVDVEHDMPIITSKPVPAGDILIDTLKTFLSSLNESATFTITTVDRFVSLFLSSLSLSFTNTVIEQYAVRPHPSPSSVPAKNEGHKEDSNTE